MKHTIELVRRHQNRDYGGHCRDVWTVMIDGIEMTLVIGETNPKVGKKHLYLRFSNNLLTKHEDYKAIRSMLLRIMDTTYYYFRITKDKDEHIQSN